MLEYAHAHKERLEPNGTSWLLRLRVKVRPLADKLDLRFNLCPASGSVRAKIVDDLAVRFLGIGQVVVTLDGFRKPQSGVQDVYVAVATKSREFDGFDGGRAKLDPIRLVPLFFGRTLGSKARIQSIGRIAVQFCTVYGGTIVVLLLVDKLLHSLRAIDIGVRGFGLPSQ
ncbi:MAG: hypothetical protein AB7O59_22370 [Pirellulales bacterium]